jgi:hypothetical protein
MILIEGGVCAAMKRDVKQAGYLVFDIQVEGEHWVGLKGNGWIVMAELESMPRKILGLIVEHAGGIPGIGISWNIQKPKKGDVQRQDVMFGMIEREVTKMLEGGEGQNAQLGQMGMTMNGYGLWQNREDLSILRLAPEMEAMAEWNGRATGSGAYVCTAGFVSWCFVLKTPWRGEHEVWRKHLEKMSWVG